MLHLIAVLLNRVQRSSTARLILTGLVCLLVGAELFATTQHVSYGTALYWAITTATTVGYGDVTPKNPAARAVAVGVMLTTIPLFASAFAVFAGAVTESRLRRLLGVSREDHAPEVIIFGMHPAVPRIAASLAAAGRDVVVVTTADRSGLPDSVRLVAADPTCEDGVRRSRPERARQLLVTGARDADVLVTAVLVHQLAPHVPSLAVAGSAKISQALLDLGITATVSADDLLAHTLTKSLETPHAGELLLRLVDSPGCRLTEIPVDDDCAGRPLSAVRAGRTGLVLGAVQNGRVTLGVDHDPLLSKGDRLLVLDPARAESP